ncbi:MAG: hypothetical protein ABI180_04245 [Microcoleus sp.]
MSISDTAARAKASYKLELKLAELICSSIRQTREEASSYLLPFLGAILTKLDSLRREQPPVCAKLCIPTSAATRPN